MPKKTLIIAAFLLLILVESAIAIPKTKDPKPKPPKTPKNPKMEPITFTETAILDAGNVYLGNQEIINGILYVQDAISTGTVNNAQSPISGFQIETLLGGKVDLNTFLGDYSGKWIINGQSAGFDGTITGKVEVATIYGKFNGQGTGNFAGQRIKGTFEGQVNNYKIEITIQATISQNRITLSQAIFS
jgi:uncharacterized protein with FMN-binding domain